MSYLDSYKKILQAKGGNVTGSDIRNSENSIIRKFKNDRSYRLAKYIKSDYILFDGNGNELTKDIRVVNVNNDFNKKIIYIPPNDKIKSGEYVYFDNYWWIVSEVNINLMTPSARLDKCNQSLHIFYEGVEYFMPCYISNDSYGSKINTTNDYIPQIDTKAKIITQYNKITKSIKSDYRFMFNHSKTDIYKISDPTSCIEDGVLTMISSKDKYLPEDDLENNLCHIENVSKDIPTNPTTYNIIGEDEIKQNIEYTYSLDNGNCTWEIDEESLNVGIAEIISFNDNSCIIKASKQRTDEYFTLIAKDNNGNILAQKEIKSLVVR